MELSQLFKSVIDQDRAPVVICDTEHTIVYMNPTAKARYAKRGGEALLGRSLLDCHAPASREQIKRILEWFQASADNNIVYEFRNDEENKDVYTVALRNDEGELIGYYEKHETRNRETMSLYDIR